MGIFGREALCERSDRARGLEVPGREGPRRLRSGARPAEAGAQKLSAEDRPGQIDM